MDEETRGRWLHAIGKHITRFRQDHLTTYVYATMRTSQEADLLLRLRKQTRVTAQKLAALARDCGLPKQEFSSALEAYVALEILEVEQKAGQLHSIREQIFTEAEVFRAVSARFEARDPEPEERALVPLMDLLSRLPLTGDEVAERLALEGFGPEDVQRALDLAEAFSLLRQREIPDLSTTLLYNEYLWGHKIEQIEPVLVGLRDRETNDLLALLEEIRQAQGTAVEALTAAPPHIIEMATRTGILDTIKIQTASGREKIFTFSPQFHGMRAGPADHSLLGVSDQVKLMLASLQYGINYSEDFRLRTPIRFLDKLLRTGTAGDATPIGRDYMLIEKQGILRTETTSGDRARFILVKEDVVRAARDALNTGLFANSGSSHARFLVEQSNFASPEALRIRAEVELADGSGKTRRLEVDHIAAIRESAQRGAWM